MKLTVMIQYIIMQQGNQKRQTFRLQIRNRQIQQKFRNMRKMYQEMLIKQEVDKNMHMQMDDQYLGHAQMEQKNSLLIIIQQLIENTIKRRRNKNSMNIAALQMHLDCIQQKSESNQYRNILSIAMNEMLERRGEILLESIRNMGQPQQTNSDEQKEQYTQQIEDYQYRKLCERDAKLFTIYEQNTSQIQRSHQKFFHSKDKRQNSMYESMDYQGHLQLMHKGIKIISMLQIQKLPLQSAIHLVEIVWHCYQSLELPSTNMEPSHIHKDIIIKQKYLHHLYLQILYKVIGIFLNLTSASNSNDKKIDIYKNLMISLGIFHKLRYIIEYVLTCKIFLISTGECQDVLLNNFVLLNFRIVELILQYETIRNNDKYRKDQSSSEDSETKDDDSNKVDENLHQYFTTFCLHTLNQYQTVVESYLTVGPRQNAEELVTTTKLYQHSLQALLTILTTNSQIIAFIQVQKYASMLNIVQICVQKCKQCHEEPGNTQIDIKIRQSQVFQCIIYLILSLFELVSQNCDKSTNQLISKHQLLDRLQQLITCIYNCLNDKVVYPNKQNAINQKTGGVYLGKLSKILSNLLYTDNKRIKQILYTHSIYQLLFDYLTNANNLFPFISLINIFVSYFICLGSKVTNKNIHRFLEIVGRLDLTDQNRDQVKEVIKITTTIYQNCKCYIKQQEMMRIRNLYSMYGFQQLINEEQQLQMCL